MNPPGTIQQNFMILFKFIIFVLRLYLCFSIFENFSNLHMSVTLQLGRLWCTWENTLVNKFLQFSAFVPQTFQSS